MSLYRFLYNEPVFGNIGCLYEWHWLRNAGSSYCCYYEIELMKSDVSINITIKQEQILLLNNDGHSDNNGDNDSDSNGNSNNNSDSDNNCLNKGDSLKKTCIQDELDTLVNHETTTT